MALLQTPKFKAQEYKLLEIESPCKNGINLKDLEYKMSMDQSPDVLNMMYRNGAFGKRYGQEYAKQYQDTVYAMANYHGTTLIHVGTLIKKLDDTQIASGIPASKGVFINFNKMIYYLCGGKFYQYDGTTWSEVVPYIPDVLINRSPNPDANVQVTDTFSGDGVEKVFQLTHGSLTDSAIVVKIGGTTQSPTTYVVNRTLGTITFNNPPASGSNNITVQYYYYVNNSEGDTIDDFNRLGSGFRQSFHGDGTTSVYQLYKGDNGSFLPYDDTPLIIKVNGTTKTQGTDYTFNRQNGQVTFTSAPGYGINNVEITAYKTQQEYINSILNNKYWCTYGGNNNSRLFLAGGGDSNYYFSDVFDASYFPESNYAMVGNTAEDITGFGEQYDVLIVFKPSEMFSLSYYTSQDTEGNEIGHFSSVVVNARVGCDCPETIQLINNLLVWCSSEYGVCTLVSTAIEDERNVRQISYNIEGGYRNSGLLQEQNLANAKSVDFDGKYFLTINGHVYMWDYQLSPYWASYLSSSSGQNNQEAKRLAWFLFDNFYVDQYLKINNNLYYINGTKIVKLNNEFNDFGEAIEGHYQTPLSLFGTAQHLKTVKNVYVQVRGDTASIIYAKYITEETPRGEAESEPIIVGGKMYGDFAWNTFAWLMVNYGNTFRRKCSLKKIQMAGVYFENDELDRDMSISNLAFEYAIVKAIK